MVTPIERQPPLTGVQLTASGWDNQTSKQPNKQTAYIEDKQQQGSEVEKRYIRGRFDFEWLFDTRKFWVKIS